jgi:hypothetical protein
VWVAEKRRREGREGVVGREECSREGTKWRDKKRTICMKDLIELRWAPKDGGNLVQVWSARYIYKIALIAGSRLHVFCSLANDVHDPICCNPGLRWCCVTSDLYLPEQLL